MRLPLTYIIVLTWNGRNDTLECLKSLSEINYPNHKIILVDNASEDGTVDAVSAQYPDVQVIINPTNLRFAAGNNAGIKQAISEGAEYIVLLNNDTIVDKNFLSVLIESAERDEKIGMAGPKIYYYGNADYLWYAGGRINWWSGWISHRGVREIDKGQYNTRCETDYITGCCLLVKRSVIEEIGLLDESYYIYGEDADWCIRAKRAGYKLIYEPSSRIWHKLSVSTGGHFSWFKNFNKFKSLIKLMYRYARWYHWLTIPFGIVGEIFLSYLKIIGFQRFHSDAK